MTGPLMILAIGALVVGAYFQWTGDFLDPNGFLMQTPSLAALRDRGRRKAFDLTVALTSTVVAVAGIGLAGCFMSPGRTWPRRPSNSAKSLGLYALSYRKFSSTRSTRP